MEGIFRRSASAGAVREVKQKINHGVPINLADYDIHVSAVLFKTLLRELPEPLLTFAFFDIMMNLRTPAAVSRVGTEETLRPRGH